MGPWVNAATGTTSSLPPLKHPVLLCGIARPHRFITMVRRAGIVPCMEKLFPDHHLYQAGDFGNRELYLNGIITTEKDAIRLRDLEAVPAEKMWYLTVNVRFSDITGKTEVFSLLDKSVQSGDRLPE